MTPKGKSDGQGWDKQDAASTHAASDRLAPSDRQGDAAKQAHQGSGDLSSSNVGELEEPASDEQVIELSDKVREQIVQLYEVSDHLAAVEVVRGGLLFREEAVNTVTRMGAALAVDIYLEYVARRKGTK